MWQPRGLTTLWTSTKFRKLALFPSEGEERETPTLLGPLKITNPSHWLSSYLEFRVMDKVKKPSDSKRHIPSSSSSGGMPSSSHLKKETDPVSETLCFLVI
jgi:hypothetical protein